MSKNDRAQQTWRFSPQQQKNDTRLEAHRARNCPPFVRAPVRATLQPQASPTCGVQLVRSMGGGGSKPKSRAKTPQQDGGGGTDAAADNSPAIQHGDAQAGILSPAQAPASTVPQAAKLAADRQRTVDDGWQPQSGATQQPQRPAGDQQRLPAQPLPAPNGPSVNDLSRDVEELRHLTADAAEWQPEISQPSQAPPAGRPPAPALPAQAARAHVSGAAASAAPDDDDVQALLRETALVEEATTSASPQPPHVASRSPSASPPATAATNAANDAAEPAAAAVALPAMAEPAPSSMRDRLSAPASSLPALRAPPLDALPPARPSPARLPGPAPLPTNTRAHDAGVEHESPEQHRLAERAPPTLPTPPARAGKAFDRAASRFSGAGDSALGGSTRLLSEIDGAKHVDASRGAEALEVLPGRWRDDDAGDAASATAHSHAAQHGSPSRAQFDNERFRQYNSPPARQPGSDRRGGRHDRLAAAGSALLGGSLVGLEGDGPECEAAGEASAAEALPAEPKPVFNPEEEALMESILAATGELPNW